MVKSWLGKFWLKNLVSKRGEIFLKNCMSVMMVLDFWRERLVELEFVGKRGLY